MPEIEISIMNNSDESIKLDSSKVECIIHRIVSDHEVSMGYVNIVFMNTEDHTNLNIKHLNHHYPTDILTFDLSDPETVNTDICINLDVARDNATEYKNTFLEELYRLIIHGTLHMCGINDKTMDEQVKMTELENHYLKVSCET